MNIPTLSTKLPTLIRYRRYYAIGATTLPALLRYRRYYATGATTLPALLRYRRYYATGATTLPALLWFWHRYCITDIFARACKEIPKINSRIVLRRYLTLYLYLISLVVTRAFIGIPIYLRLHSLLLEKCMKSPNFLQEYLAIRS